MKKKMKQVITILWYWYWYWYWYSSPKEEKGYVIKDAFYAKHEDKHHNFPDHFNAKLGREGILFPTVRQFSLHVNTTFIGIRLIDFAEWRNMEVWNTKFQHPDIHKASWMSPVRAADRSYYGRE